MKRAVLITWHYYTQKEISRSQNAHQLVWQLDFAVDKRKTKEDIEQSNQNDSKDMKTAMSDARTATSDRKTSHLMLHSEQE